MTHTQTLNTLKKLRINPSWLQMGDHIWSEEHDVTIRYIDGPDHNGTYDIFGINELGNPQKIIATEFVTLLK